MTQETEPSNKVLANFLVVYAQQIPQFQGLVLSSWEIERQLEIPEFRKIALKYHKAFQQQIDDLHAKCVAGELQCDYIRPNGKKCPNRNTPGTYYCGLHQNEV